MLKILVADDSDVVRQLVKAALSGANGWSICGEAANGQQAVQQARQLKPDLIVMDLAMPLLDGLHAAAEILKFAASLPIILYTLHKTSEMELEAKKAGLRAVVSKSDDIKELLGAVEQLAHAAAAASPIAAISGELFKSAITPEASEALPVAAADQSTSSTVRRELPLAATSVGATPASPKVESAEATPTAETLSNPPDGNAGS